MYTLFGVFGGGQLSLFPNKQVPLSLAFIVIFAFQPLQ